MDDPYGTATFERFKLYRNSKPRGVSAAVQLVIESITTGASLP